MKHIEDSKIGTIRSKPDVKYPMIRLPQEYSEIIGLRAHIYKTDYDGRLAFMVVPYSKDKAQLASKPNSKVSKLSLETDVETRLSALESQINGTEITSSFKRKRQLSQKKQMGSRRFERPTFAV
jgi:hypothetical protein